MEIIYQLLGVGALGAFIKIVIEDGGLILPELKAGKLFFGGIGGLIVGAVAGVLADHDPITAFAAGYAGTSLIQGLMDGRKLTSQTACETIKETIIRICKAEKVDPDLATRVANCESGLNPTAVNVNADGSTDRGLFQINNKYHPEVSDADAYNAEKSTQFFCMAFKAGNLNWWSASKNCWDK